MPLPHAHFHPLPPTTTHSHYPFTHFHGAALWPHRQPIRQAAEEKRVFGPGRTWRVHCVWGFSPFFPPVRLTHTPISLSPLSPPSPSPPAPEPDLEIAPPAPLSEVEEVKRDTMARSRAGVRGLARRFLLPPIPLTKCRGSPSPVPHPSLPPPLFCCCCCLIACPL